MAGLVRHGVGAHSTNSFLVFGSTDKPAELWPDDRLARYFSIHRRRQYAASTSVRAVDEGTRIDRTYSSEPGPLVIQGMTTWTMCTDRRSSRCSMRLTAPGGAIC